MLLELRCEAFECRGAQHKKRSCRRFGRRTAKQCLNADCRLSSLFGIGLAVSARWLLQFMFYNKVSGATEAARFEKPPPQVDRKLWDKATSSNPNPAECVLSHFPFSPSPVLPFLLQSFKRRGGAGWLCVRPPALTT